MLEPYCATPAAVRAALQLGPIETVCNVCGSVHVLPQTDPELVSVANYRNWGADGYGLYCCVVRRVAGAIALAYARPLQDAFANIDDEFRRRKASLYAGGLRRDLRDASLQCYVDFNNAVESVSDWTGLINRARSLVSRPRIGMGFFDYYYASRCMERCVGASPERMRRIDASLPDSAWTVALSSADADREIIQAYLDVLLDPAMWARISRMFDLMLSEWRADAHAVKNMRRQSQDVLKHAAKQHDALQQAAARMRSQEGIVYATLDLCP